MPAHAITIRRAVPADGQTLTRLALLDSARELRGTILVAESRGKVHAAWSLEERRGVADPFEPTADDLALLRTRAQLLHAGIQRPRLRRAARKGLATAH
jgi:hypothetical protein